MEKGWRVGTADPSTARAAENARGRGRVWVGERGQAEGDKEKPGQEKVLEGQPGELAKAMMADLGLLLSAGGGAGMESNVRWGAFLCLHHSVKVTEG